MKTKSIMKRITIVFAITAICVSVIVIILKTTIMNYTPKDMGSFGDAYYYGDYKCYKPKYKRIGNFFFKTYKDSYIIGGEEIPIDYKKAFYWYKQRAKYGDENAKLKIAEFYIEGEIVPRNYEKAISLYEKYAELGYEKAQLELANLYKEGEIVPKDYDKVIYWYTRCAEQGNWSAQEELGWIYDLGIMVPQDYEKAVYWYRKSAEQWHYFSLWQLESLAEYGNESAKKAVEEIKELQNEN